MYKKNGLYLLTGVRILVYGLTAIDRRLLSDGQLIETATKRAEFLPREDSVSSIFSLLNDYSAANRPIQKKFFVRCEIRSVIDFIDFCHMFMAKIRKISI